MPDISPQPLYPIAECPDLMADGYIGDEDGTLLFLSVWARDTAIQQFLARLTLGSDDEGLDRLRIVIDDTGRSIPTLIGNVGRLDKRSTRVFRRTLFGSIVNLWLFDRRCVKPDKANASALAFLRRSDEDGSSRLWSLVQDTCPLPLLDHWRDTVMDLLIERAMLGCLPTALGPLEGHRLALDVPMLTGMLGDLIRDGVLLPSPADDATGEPLRRAA